MRALRPIAYLSFGIICSGWCQGQFAKAYVHQFSDDHSALERSILGTTYVQASTKQGANKDIHLMKFDANGAVLLDVVFHSPAGDEVALDICRGNNHTYLVCGYETVGGLDLGFVLQVDTNFNFLGKTNIQVPTNDRHTPALNIINSAFYWSPPSINTYFPPDPTGGYLVTGFEAEGFNPTDAKKGYALKIDDNLQFQWVTKFNSPNPPGSTDWDMCSHASYIYGPAQGYFIGGSSTSPNGDQVAMAAYIDRLGGLYWSKRYHETAGNGQTSVSVDAAYDDAAGVDELYQLINLSSSSGGGFITFERSTGNFKLPLCSRFLANTPNYFVYEFGTTCASDPLLISGYGHNQTSGSTSGFFPFTFRYFKNSGPSAPPPLVDPSGARFAYPIESSGYGPSTTIYDSYQTGGHPRIYYPKLYAQLLVNEITLAAFEEIGGELENYLVQPYVGGEDSCAYIDPNFTAVPITLDEWPLPAQLDTMVLTPGTYNSFPVTSQVRTCNDCPPGLGFVPTLTTGCQYTFTSNNSTGACPQYLIYDVANTLIATLPGPVVNFTFPGSGTYKVCYTDCYPGQLGVVCHFDQCQTITVNCTTPCPVDADFSYAVNGCCVTFLDLTPDGDPLNCEQWVFGNITTVYAVDATSYCFPGPGTYTVCHVECCEEADGSVTTVQVCKNITVNCTPPCCLPTGINLSVSGCCVTASPILPGGPCATPMIHYWTFGDGNISYQQNPTHCYGGSGTYTVCLTVVCSRSQKVQFCQSIKVGCISPPPPLNGGGGTARFSYNASGTFVALTPFPPPPDRIITSQLWTFGDGTSSTAGSPTKYFPLSGTYHITHVVEGIDLGSGTPFIEEHTVPITLVLAPACGCIPPPMGAFAGNALVCGQSNSVWLKLIDHASESDVVHQWMRSTCGGPDCALSEFEPIPGAVGQHVWIDGVTETSYFRCRSMSSLGFVSWSDEVEVVAGAFTLNVQASSNPVCPGDPVTLTAMGAVDHDWSTGETTGSIDVTPYASSTYTVDGTNAAGCLEEATVTVDVVTAGCGVFLNARALLEGPLDAGTGLMNDQLRAGGLLPLQEPYTALGYPWPAGSSGGSTSTQVLGTEGSDAITDWVLLELRDAGAPTSVIETRSALLQRDGDIVELDGLSPVRFLSPPAPYHVAVRHRNHLGAMTGASLLLTDTPTPLDFSSDALGTWGADGRKPIGLLRALWAGDVTFNGQLRYAGSGNDRDPMLITIGGTVPTNTVTGYKQEDVNMDGVVKYAGSGNDRDPILTNIGGTVPTQVRDQQLP